MTYICNEGACNFRTPSVDLYMEHMMEHGYDLKEAAELAKDIRSVNDAKDPN